MKCPSCQHENRPSAKFCTRCRTKLQAVCPKCGAEYEPGDAFCGECGADLPAAGPATPEAKPATLQEQFTSFQQSLPESFREQLLTPLEGENRLVTVLFADMSSSVRKTGDLHPEEAAALINRLLGAMVDILLRYEGRVDRFLGDGVLAVFGVPQAHESDPERAIHSAIEIRDAAQSFGLNATGGINTGEVYAGGIGSERHREVTVMGPVVNLAARLQGSAEPGQILVGESTYRQTRRAFQFSPLSLELKGIPGRVAAYALERMLPRPEKVRGIEGLRAELIGREEEFTRLQGALTEVRVGRGQMVSLIGEAGVGKSRLVSELKATVGSRPETGGSPDGGHAGGTTGDPSLPPTANCRPPTPLWLEGRCLELGMSAGYWVFVDLFRQFFGWQAEDEESARGDRIAAALQQMTERRELAEGRIEEIGPLLGNLLSVRFGNDWDERLKNASPEQIKFQTFVALRDFFVALARRQPLVLVFDDLHWADSLSLDVISLLMESLTLAPLLLLCVYRPEREHKCWHLAAIAGRKCAERYTELRLRELTPPESQRLIESLLTIERLPAAVKELVLQKSHGNPFFVEEVVRALVDGGMVYQENGVWRAQEGIEAVAVPESIQSVILSRVDRLEQNLKGVLESASVIGRLFRRRLLGYLRAEETELERALWELEDRQLIYQERVVPEVEYSFQHVLTQETIYQSILRRRRAVFHQKVAEAIEALYAEALEEYYEQLAYHYERSGAGEKAIEYLLKAGEKSRRAYLNEEAVRYFQRALERLDAQAPAMEDAQASPAHAGTQLAATAGGLNTQLRLKALTGLGQTHYGMGRRDEAADCFRPAIALGEEVGLAPEELVRLYYWLGLALTYGTDGVQQQRNVERYRVAEKGLALLGKNTPSVETALMNSLLDARESAERNAPFLRQLPYTEELRPAYIDAARGCLEEGDLGAAEEWLAALARHAEQHHDLRALGDVSYVMGFLLARKVDAQGASLQFQQGAEIFAKIGDPVMRSLCRFSEGEQRLAVGEREAGIEALQESMFGAAALREMYFFERALAQLEEAYESPEAFRAFCRRLHQAHPDAGGALFQHWYLELSEIGRGFEVSPAIRDEFSAPLASEWVWQDPEGDCSLTVRNGLEISARQGRDLWRNNMGAPRLLRSAAGDFAVEAVCGPGSMERPAVGGILLWKDARNFLRLERGLKGQREIGFERCLDGEHAIIGRGRLPTDRISLRLEREGDQVRALCSSDGNEWFLVGQVGFPVEDPVQLGPHALGVCSPLLRAVPEGTSIRFESFRSWRARAGA